MLNQAALLALFYDGESQVSQSRGGSAALKDALAANISLSMCAYL